MTNQEKKTREGGSHWQEILNGAKKIGLSLKQIKWLRGVIFDERQRQANITNDIFERRISSTKCECCDLCHIFKTIKK